MSSMSKIVNLLKKSSIDALETKDPMRTLFGEVVKEEPLEVLVEQRLLLTKDFLILTRNVQDHELEVIINHKTENAGDPQHSHEITGQKTITVLNGLRKGDSVLMLSMQGGQRFVILDKLNK
ncbi:DUF2577 domain-containing protein [Bacillus sp. S/N-304-OC-R1]|uniref:DUF2577 domain-containing protein n=1 Tax=Bacillus sp. S/N-304-OC-R1 TaxID=2758034 RepID=UPI001C8E2076|nr:DUF2577 domain-containing protein [Bacillus sp. S/N-304-OC-R1]MBY0124497.1 DUF2577 domain-containing protein [Bacillus sp. S/N-304-OC-R1]